MKIRHDVEPQNALRFFPGLLAVLQALLVLKRSHPNKYPPAPILCFMDILDFFGKERINVPHLWNFSFESSISVALKSGIFENVQGCQLIR